MRGLHGFRDKTVLVTGGSSGIGAELVRVFVGAGANVITTARRADRLAALVRETDPSGDRIVGVAADLTVDGELERVVATGRARFGSLDVVVANAGIGIPGSVRELTLDDYRRQFEVNVFGVLRTIQLTLDDLVERQGRLAIVGSVNGYQAFADGSAYAMSKFAVRALADSLRVELAPHGVSVTHLAPGFVDTEFRRVDADGNLGKTDGAPAWLRMPADVAARKMAKAIARRSPERVLTAHGKAGVFAARHLPRLMRWSLSRARKRSGR